MVEINTQHTFSGATAKMKEGAVDFKDAVKETATQTAEKYYDQTTEMIKSSPYKSLLIAFGAGALLGMFFFRGKK